MSYENGNARGGVNSQKSLATAPVALAGLLLLFFTATSLADDVMIDTDKWVILPIAVALAAVLGRIGVIAPLGNASSHRTAVISLGFVALAFVANALGFADPILATTFTFVGIATLLLVQSERNEEATILMVTIAAFHLSVSYAAAMPELTLAEGTQLQTQLIDLQRGIIGADFFAFWFASIVYGVILAILFRGTLDEAGRGRIFAHLPERFDLGSAKETLIFMGVILSANLIPLFWLAGFTDAAVFESHLYLGSVWAITTTIIVMFVAFCRAERWHVIGALVALNWIIYSLAHLVEIGNHLPARLEFFAGNDTMGAGSWFLLTFWANVLAVMLGVRGYFGDIAPRREPSGYRIWWNDNSYPILVGSAVIIGFAIRTGWNVMPAMNANITGLWDMTGGSDPWYMKRVVDYIVAERSHFIFDADRAYPSGGINPRPPLFSWCLALGGLALEWLTGTPAEEVVWWSVAGFPAIFGALIVLPIAGIAHRLHSAQAGVIAAWLMALMPGHISHSTFGLADHDAFALLFLTLAFYYWIKAVDGIGSERIFRDPSPNPLYLIAGIREMWRRNPATMANATLAGISFATVALGWKGFVYGPGILFLAYAAQIVLNMFRRRDSLPLTAAAMQMMMTTFVVPLPFYIWPGLNLLLAPSGFQPMFYILGFTIALGWVASSYRDKPWLLVLCSGAVLFGGILVLLRALQELDIYNGWDILFTGGFYFSKNKIFGTIGEAQAPSRGILFASYGPIVSLIAIGYAFALLWRGTREDKQGHALLGLWVLIATYMAWTAGRFIFNATPAMAVVGAIGIAAMWKRAEFSVFVKEWRRSGIGTPRARLRSIKPASKKRPAIPALLLVLMLVVTQHATYGIDAGIPRGETAAGDVDQTIYDLTPDILRLQDPIFGFSVLDGSTYSPSASCNGGCWYMGTFGPGFNGGGWNLAYEWLSEQDADVPFGNRPAFVSWWDYGFQALNSGEHPTVADNFQSGIPNSGAMLLASGQTDTLAMFIATLAQGDRRYTGDGGFSDEFTAALNRHLNYPQQAEFADIMSFGFDDRSFVEARALAVIAEDAGVELLHGVDLDSNGMPSEPMWYVYLDGEQIGNSTTNESAARAFFDQTRANSQPYKDKITHYQIGGYRYTADLIEDFGDISTNLHRVNAKLGLARAFLTSAFTLEELVDLYDDLTTSIEYEVQDYEGALGQTIFRNNEIRYFAIDDRLYPLGGRYYEDSSYHRGQTTGIFYAPTTLSGLDPDHYIESVYLTQRGTGPIIPMTQAQYEQEYLNDIVRQQSGALQDSTLIIQLVDIDYQQTDSFFETMISRIYVGYGSSSLGLVGDPAQPGPTWAIGGTPNSILENAFPLPGAMMNHFVIANWYDDGSSWPDADNNSVADIHDGGFAAIGRANTNVKVVKYYSGATIEGSVELDGFGPIPNARILIERDAFSGEEVADENGSIIDQDPRSYWIPIGTVDADENGDYSFIVPAGRIRVSAFFGEPNLDTARAQLSSGAGGMLSDLATDSYTTERNVNLITGILGNVSGSQWLAETIVNISGTAGHSNGVEHIVADITVTPSFATGRLIWAGNDAFDGDAITDAVVELTASWSMITLDPIPLMTSTGTVSGPNLAFQGIGEVTFTGEGEVISNGVVSVDDFYGTHMQTILHGHSLTAVGQFSGRGTLSGVFENESVIDGDCNENGTMPENYSVCSLADGDHLIDGVINATGRFTSNGTSSFSQIHNGSSLSGSGVFTVDASDEDIETYGTINGTGTFSGEGVFSGPMVQEGTFHLINAIPGSYDVTIIFSDGTRVEISDGFTVPYSGIPSVTAIDVAGGWIEGKLVDDQQNPILHPVSLQVIDSEDADAVSECADIIYAPCLITPDENGTFTYGPVVPGDYIVSLDADSDGFTEVDMIYFFDADMPTELDFPSPVPTVHDLTFTLTRTVNGTQESVSDLNLTLVSADGNQADVDAVFDGEDDSYHVELIDGEWIISHTYSPTEQMWEQIEIDGADINADYVFRQSTQVSGIVYYDTRVEPGEIDDAQPIEHVPVYFHWEGFSTASFTNGQGIFTVVLPVGAVVDATVHAGTMNVVNGTRFTVAEDMQNITMVARPGSEVSGALNLNRLGNFYSSNLIGWEVATVLASHESIDAVWHIEVADDGMFSTVLPQGNWTFTTDLEWLNATNSTLNVDGKNDTINIILKPGDSFIEIDFFLDHEGDNDLANGTLVEYRFSIVPINAVGQSVDVTVDGDEWTGAGHARVPIEAGEYRIDIEISDARAGDLFGTRIMTGDPFFVVGLGGDVIERSIGFDPEWRVDFTLTNESGGALADQNVRFINIETGWILSRLTDGNGSLVDHLPEGDWIVSIVDVDNGQAVMEGLRERITVSSANAETEHSFSTRELAFFTIDLWNEGNATLLDGMELILTSNENLGNITLDPTGVSGQVDSSVVSGSWNIELNFTDDGNRWIIETTLLAEDGVVSGANGVFDIELTQLVKMSGTIFWDLDDDDDADVAEGVPDVSIHMTSEDAENITLVTDASGQWNVFVPLNSTWHITTNRTGFSEENLSVAMNNPNSIEIELSAGFVDISGVVTYDDLTSLGDDVILELIPVEGMVRDRVTPVKTLVNGTWNGSWTATVEPGNWIIRATDESLNLIAMAVVEADIATGGSVDIELRHGGWLHLSTEWLDYNGTQHSLAESNVMGAQMVEDPSFTLSTGASVEWAAILDASGSISILMPSGTIEVSSEFEVNQMNRTMEYTAGKNINVPASGTDLTASVTQELKFSRITNHEIDSSTTNMAGGNATVPGDLSDVTVLFDEDGNYSSVDYTLSLDYLGDEPISTFTVVGTVGGTDGSDWAVTFFNPDSQTWDEEFTFQFGLLDTNNSTTYDDLRVRVTPANLSTAHSFEAGHNVRILIQTADGYSFEHSLTVRIPQFHSFELTEEMVDIYGIRPGESLNIGIKFTNAGNGDERFGFEFDDTQLPEYWERTGATSHTVGAFVASTHTLTVMAPANATGEEDFTFTVNVTDKSGGTYQPLVIHVRTSLPVLTIIEVTTGTEPTFGNIHTFMVKVENSGLVDAKNVVINATVQGTDVHATQTLDILAGAEVIYFIDVNFTTFGPEQIWIDFTIEDEDQEFANDPAVKSKRYTLKSPAIDDSTATNVIMYALAIMLLVALFYLTRGGTRRPGAPF